MRGEGGGSLGTGSQALTIPYKNVSSCTNLHTQGEDLSHGLRSFNVFFSGGTSLFEEEFLDVVLGCPYEVKPCRGRGVLLQ